MKYVSDGGVRKMSCPGHMIFRLFGPRGRARHFELLRNPAECSQRETRVRSKAGQTVAEMWQHGTTAPNPAWISGGKRANFHALVDSGCRYVSFPGCFLRKRCNKGSQRKKERKQSRRVKEHITVSPERLLTSLSSTVWALGHSRETFTSASCSRLRHEMGESDWSSFGSGPKSQNVLEQIPEAEVNAGQKEWIYSSVLDCMSC